MGDREKAPWDQDGWIWRDGPPRTDNALAIFHGMVADGVRREVVGFFDAAVVLFGEDVAEAMAMAFLETTNNLRSPDKLRDLGWRDFIDDNNWTDWIDMTQRFRDCVRYGIEGTAPQEYNGRPRELRVRDLHDVAASLLENAWRFLPDEAVWALHFAKARFAYDFGARFTLLDLQLLSQIGYAAARNAVAAGELILSDDGTLDHGHGSRWLERRRGFLRSRWKATDDDQEPISLVRGDSDAFTQVPQSEDGPFLPETAVRRNRATGGLHVTIGSKGEEESVADFFEALGKLARMPTPRWRRRNAQGNWGIVRARGAWASVPTDLIRTQLAAFTAEN